MFPTSVSELIVATILALCILPRMHGMTITKDTEDSGQAASSHFDSYEGFDGHQYAGFGHEFGSDGGAGDYAESHGEHQHLFANEIESHHDDFDTKPVPSIDHGKGAFSYSSLYEFKDADKNQEHELHNFT